MILNVYDISHAEKRTTIVAEIVLFELKYKLTSISLRKRLT